MAAIAAAEFQVSADPPPVLPVVYPAPRGADVVLAGGATVRIRPIRPDDVSKLVQFYRRWPVEELVLRFFSAGIDIERLARRFCVIDYRNEFGLVAIAGPDERVVAHASYACTAPHHAEVAFGVADDHQGRGLCTLLLGHLAQVAAANGITEFEAEVLAHNHHMVSVLRTSGFPVQVQPAPDSLRITLPTSHTPNAIERFEQRERLVTVAALRPFLAARVVAANSRVCTAAADSSRSGGARR